MGFLLTIAISSPSTFLGELILSLSEGAVAVAMAAPDSIQKDISNLNYDDLNFSHEEYFKRAKTADEVKDLFYKLPSVDQKEGTTAYKEAIARNEAIEKAS